MIIVKISGGLGNQLFQYAFGRYLACQLNTFVEYDIQTIQNAKNFTKRSLGILDFNIQIDIASKKNIGKLKYFTQGIFVRIERKLSQKLPILFKSYFVESGLHSEIDKMYIKDNCYYDGYWQSFRYLETNRNLLIEQISISKISEEDKLLLINNQINNSPSISIHIRRGDYISIKKNSDIFHVCSMAYYDKAIAYFKDRYINPKFHVFTDDIEWAKMNFVGNQFNFVVGNEPAEDMILMSRCKHNIIANSTFSWWGAWLNTNEQKIVIAPKQWYIGDLNKLTVNLIPDTWIRI